MRRELLDQRVRVAQQVVAALVDAAQPREVAGREQREVAGDEPQREVAHGRVGVARRPDVLPPQLQREALGRAARADARRVEALQQRQRRLQLLLLDLELRRQHREDVVELVAEIALFLERLDQHRDEAAVALVQLLQRELAEQVLAQRDRRHVDVREVAVVVVAVAAAIARAPVGRGEVVDAPLTAFEVGDDDAVRAAGRVVARGVRCHVAGVVRRRRVEVLVEAGPLHRPVAVQLDGRMHRVVDALEQRVLGERDLDFLVQLERRQLQQPDRLLQLRRQREMLRDAELEDLLHVVANGLTS